MNANGRQRRIRFVLTPISPDTGQPTGLPSLVYTVPAHRAPGWWWRFCHLNDRNPAAVTPGGYWRYDRRVMDEWYYQEHRLAGAVHRGARLELLPDAGAA